MVIVTPFQATPHAVDRDVQGRVTFVCNRPDGTTYQAKPAVVTNLVDALLRSWSEADPGRRIDPKGLPRDQSYYLTSYQILPLDGDPQSPPPSDPWEDPALIGAYRSPQWEQVGWRLAKTTPGMMLDAGLLTYREQTAAWGAMLDGDLADLWPKSDTRYANWYAYPKDQTKVEKLAWNEERMQLFENEVLPKLLVDCPWVDRCVCWYTTANGWRLVWLFDQPVPVSGAAGCLEDIVGGMMVDLARAGVGVDTGCRDWTRLMRVPRCIKAGTDLGKLPYFRMSWNGIETSSATKSHPSELQTVNPRELPLLSEQRFDQSLLTHPHKSLILKAARVHTVDAGTVATVSSRQFQWSCGNITVDLGSPLGPDQIYGAITAGEKNTITVDLMFKRLKKAAAKDTTRLTTSREDVRRASMLSALLIDKQSNLHEFAKYYHQEGLHYGSFFAVRDMVSFFASDLSVGIKGLTGGQVTPQIIQALISVPYMAAMKDREGQPGYRDDATVVAEVWRSVDCHIRGHLGFLYERQQEQEEDSRIAESVAQASSNTQHQIIEFLKRCFISGGSQDDERLEQYLADHWKRYLMLRHKDKTRILCLSQTREPYYSNVAASFKEVKMIVRDCGHPHINLYAMNNKGDFVPMSEEDILEAYATPVEIGSYSRTIRCNQIRVRVGHSGEENVLIDMKLPGMAPDLDPTYDPVADEFLRLMVAGDVDRGMDWFACYGDLDKRLAALFIGGSDPGGGAAPGIGKKLLVDSLALRTERGKMAKFENALGDFQSDFFDTPLVVVNEHIPLGNNRTKSVINVFKEIVSGDFRHLNRKNIDLAEINSNWRLVVTANNEDLLKFDTEATDNDVEGVVERIFHVIPNEVALREFHERLQAEAAAGTGPGHQGLDLRIAKHLVWLERNRAVQAYHHRFYVCGVRHDFHENLRANSPISDYILQVFEILLFDSSKRNHPAMHLQHRTHRSYIQPREFFNLVNQMFPSAKLRFTQIQPRLKKMSVGETCINAAGRGSGKSWVLEVNLSIVLAALHRAMLKFDARDLLGDEWWAEVAPTRVLSDLERMDIEAEANSDGEVANVPKPPESKIIRGKFGKNVAIPM